MHVPRFAADKGFIHFDRALHLANASLLERVPDAVKHEPSRSLRHSNIAAKFVTTDSVFAVDQQPEGDHPLVHSKRAILENGSDLHGELLLAGFTEPETASRDEGVLV